MNADRIREGLEELALGARTLAADAPRVEAVARRYAAVLAAGGTLFFAGNGGSAAHAQHITAEYVVRFRRERRALRAVALTADTAVLTAGGNDLGMEAVFARQLQALGRPGDLLVLVSTSGASPNLLRAAEAARRLGIGTVGLLGRDGGALAPLLDEVIIVPGEQTSRIQELQLAVDHLIVEQVEEELGE